jgi:hypothetical protein
MAGQASGGQQLTPNNNVTAVAGMGGDVWGAFGGGAVPIGGGVSGQTGFGKPISATLSDGETATNYLQGTPSVKALESNTALSGQTLDSALASGGSNAG